MSKTSPLNNLDLFQESWEWLPSPNDYWNRLQLTPRPWPQDEWMDERMNEWMSEWINEWMNELTNERFISNVFQSLASPACAGVFFWLPTCSCWGCGRPALCKSWCVSERRTRWTSAGSGDTGCSLKEERNETRWFETNPMWPNWGVFHLFLSHQGLDATDVLHYNVKLLIKNGNYHNIW